MKIRPSVAKRRQSRPKQWPQRKQVEIPGKLFFKAGHLSGIWPSILPLWAEVWILESRGWMLGASSAGIWVGRGLSSRNWEEERQSEGLSAGNEARDGCRPNHQSCRPGEELTPRGASRHTTIWKPGSSILKQALISTWKMRGWDTRKMAAWINVASVETHWHLISIYVFYFSLLLSTMFSLMPPCVYFTHGSLSVCSPSLPRIHL